MVALQVTKIQNDIQCNTKGYNTTVLCERVSRFFFPSFYIASDLIVINSFTGLLLMKC